MSRLMTVLLMLLIGAAANTANAQSGGTLIDLGTLGGTRTIPMSINDFREVAGFSFLAGDAVQRPFLWVNGVMHPLDVLPGHTQGQARAINNLHQVVGTTFAGSLGLITGHAVLWENGTATDLNTAATAADGWLLVAALGINDAGQIVGYGFRYGTFTQRAFLHDHGVVTELATLGGAQAVAASINRSGQISGLAYAADGSSHAVTWTRGVIKDLGGSNGPGFNVANRINDFGDAVGSWAASSAGIPMYWDPSGAPVTLPLLDASGTALSINNLRQIVGSGNVAGGTAIRAVLWQDGAPIDVETLVPPGANLAAASAINNAGQIVGWTDSVRGFLIQLPVPAAGVAAVIDSLVTDAGVQAGLIAKINGAAGNPVAECNALRAVANEIKAQSGKKIAEDTASQLIETIDAATTACQ